MCQGKIFPENIHRRCAMIILWVTCAVFTGFSQTHYHFFYGKIIESQTQRGIPGANITFERSTKGTVSGKDGEFSFYMDTLPQMMIISHIGFETKRVLLDKTSWSLTIYLQPHTELLPEVTVTAKTQYEPFFKEPFYNVLDYETDTSLLYLLITDLRNSRTTILCRDLNSETIARSGELAHAKRLFRDCLGNIHLFTADSAYQLYLDGDEIKLLYPVELKKFREVMMNCVLSTDEALFIKTPGENNQTVSYTRVNRKGKQRVTLSTIEDSLKTRMLRRNPRDNSLLGQSVQPIGREDFVDWSYVHKILYRPVSTALYKFGDFICIFNTTDATIEYYDKEGAYAYKLKLMVKNVSDGTWTKEIYNDPSTSKVYTTFNADGYIHLYRIDMNTGELRNVFTLEHLFPEKIKFLKGYLLYLYHPAGSGKNRDLYRQRL
jgi:hypothetical protein